MFSSVLVKAVISNGLQTSLLYNFNRWQRPFNFTLFKIEEKTVRLSLHLKNHSSVTGFCFHKVATFISSSSVPKGHASSWQISYLKSGSADKISAY